MITERMQVQAITNLLAGVHNEDLDLTGFSDSNRAVYTLLNNAPQDARQAILGNLVDINPRLEVLVGQVVNQRPSGLRMNFENEEIDVQGPDLPPVEYLWPGWIPRRELSIIVADPGVGKTYFVVDLVRRMMNNAEMPDGQQAQRKRQTILYIDAEDYLSGIYKRVREFRDGGMWPKKNGGFYVRPYPETNILDFGKEEWRDDLVERVAALRPDWLIIDSLTSSIIRYTFDEDVLPVVTFLKRLAKQYNIAITILHHNNKSSGNRQSNDTANVSGAGIFARRSRVIIGMDYISTNGKVDKRKDPRRVYIIKSNDLHPERLAFRYQDLHPRGAYLDYFDPSQMLQAAGEEKATTDDVLNAIQELGEWATAKNIAEELDLSAGYVRLLLKELEAANTIEKAGRGKPYILVEEKSEEKPPEQTKF